MSALWDFIKSIFRGKPGVERLSPQDWLPAAAFTQSADRRYIQIDLQALKDRLDLEEYPIRVWDAIPNTNSMDPVFDEGNSAMLFYGANPRDHAKLVESLIEGDIAVYEKSDKGLVIHRIVKIGFDKSGQQIYTFMGDNNSGIADKPDVRPDQIRFVSLGTSY